MAATEDGIFGRLPENWSNWFNWRLMVRLGDSRWENANERK